MDRPNLLEALDKLECKNNYETNTISIDVVIKEDFEAEIVPDDFHPWKKALLLALHEMIWTKPKMIMND